MCLSLRRRLQPCKKIVILPDLPVFHAQRDIPQTQLLQAFLRKAGLFPQLPQSTGPRVVQFGLLKMAAYADQDGATTREPTRYSISSFPSRKRYTAVIFRSFSAMVFPSVRRTAATPMFPV